MTTLRRSFRRVLLRSQLLRRGWHLIATARMASVPGRSVFQNLKSLLAARDYPAPARALHWIRRNELPTGGIRVHSRHPAAYPEVTGYLIPTLLTYGETELAARCTQWLVRIQAADGSFADPDQGLAYIFDTGQALRGLLATVDMVPEAAASARRAADYLCRQAVDGGRSGFDVRYPDSDPLSTHLYVLPPLFQAAELFGEAHYTDTAERCLEYYCSRPDALRLETLTHDLGYELEALIDLGRRDLAAPVLEQLCRLQRGDGSLRGVGGQEWVCTPGLAQIAVCWYKTGQHQPADKALAWLEKQQLWCGGFFGSYGRGASYFPDVAPAWAVKFFLDAHRLRRLASAEPSPMRSTAAVGTAAPSRPLVSVVLPVWNAERYLRQSIESCLRQSYGHLELIIVDDGSTDSTPAIIEDYARRDARIRIFTHGGNRGLPQALNTGFAAARGEYLTWTSDDNYFHTDAIRRLVDFLESNTDADLVYTDCTLVDPEDRVLERRTAGEARQLLFGNCIGCCFLYRRKVLEALGGYNEDLFLAEDYDYWLRASVRFRLVPLHEDLYCVRDHQNALSVRFEERAAEISDRCLEQNLPHLGWATRPQKAAAYLSLARRAQARGRWRPALRHAWSAFRVAPLGSLRFLARRILRLPRLDASTEAQ